MSGTACPIRAAVPRDAGAIASLISAAFLDLGANAWLIPDRQRRHPLFTAFFAAEVHHALGRPDAVVHVAEGPHAGIVGATVWTDSADPGPDSPAAIREFVDDDTLDRFTTVPVPEPVRGRPGLPGEGDRWSATDPAAR